MESRLLTIREWHVTICVANCGYWGTSRLSTSNYTFFSSLRSHAKPITDNFLNSISKYSKTHALSVNYFYNHTSHWVMGMRLSLVRQQ